MSKRIRKLERGAADLVTIAVGLTIIAIAAIGTSYSLLYGRQALIHQEHYKSALYKLRGFMEEQTARVRFTGASEVSYRNDLTWMLAPQELEVELDTRTDRDGNAVQTFALMRREAFEYGDNPLTKQAPDYYRIRASIVWQEPIIAGDMAGSESELTGPDKAISLQSTFVIPG